MFAVGSSRVFEGEPGLRAEVLRRTQERIQPAATASAVSVNTIPNGWDGGQYSTVKTPSANIGGPLVDSELVGTQLPSTVRAEVLATGLVVAPVQNLGSTSMSASDAVDYSPLATAQEVADQRLISASEQSNSGVFDLAKIKMFFGSNKALIGGAALILGVGYFSARGA